MSPLSQTRLLMPLLEAIRNLLGPGEYASFSVTAHGSPCIEARTERGNVTASVVDDGRYAFDTARGLYACSTDSTKDDIYNTIRQALNDAREEWA